MNLISWMLIFIASTYFLVKSADYFVISAEKIGQRLKLSPLLIGITILAFGTSLPELITSILAVMKGTTEIVAGNVIGSNIANILLVLGLAGLVSKEFKIKDSIGDVKMLFISTIFLILTTIDGEFTLIESIIGLILFGSYLWRVKSNREKRIEIIKLDENKKLNNITILQFFGSILIIYLSAEYIIRSVIELSSGLGIGTEVIAASAVAIGTSLPEVMVSITAAKQKKLSLALGNVIGSNIFNGFLIMGVGGLLSSLIISQKIILIGLPTLLISTIFYLLIFKDKKLDNTESVILLSLYTAFIIALFLI